MPTTGMELNRIFQQNIDKNFTQYTSIAGTNRWMKQSYVKVIQDIYLDRLNQQNSFDELSYLVSLNTVKNVVNNQVFHAPIPLIGLSYAAGTVTATTEFNHNLVAGDIITLNGVLGGGFTVLNGVPQTTTFASANVVQFASAAILGVWTAGTGTMTTQYMYSDYFHYLFAKLTFVAPYYNVNITDSSNSLPIRIVTNVRTTLRDKDQILIAGITGNTNANGRRYVRWLNNKLLSLYQDENLQTPIAGNGISAGTGTITEIITSNVKTWFYDQKNTIYGDADVYNPKVQQGKLLFQIYPNTPCETMYLDYIRRQPVEIDVANDDLDYERFYPFYFLEKISIEAGRLFSKSARDGNLDVGLTQEVLENP